MIKPVVSSGSETRTMKESDMIRKKNFEKTTWTSYTTLETRQIEIIKKYRNYINTDI